VAVLLATNSLLTSSSGCRGRDRAPVSRLPRTAKLPDEEHFIMLAAGRPWARAVDDKQLLRDVASWLFGWPNMLVWMIPLLILLSLLGAGR
jgi:hypothetical protein